MTKIPMTNIPIPFSFVLRMGSCARGSCASGRCQMWVGWQSMHSQSLQWTKINKTMNGGDTTEPPNYHVMLCLGVSAMPGFTCQVPTMQGDILYKYIHIYIILYTSICTDYKSKAPVWLSEILALSRAGHGLGNMALTAWIASLHLHHTIPYQITMISFHLVNISMYIYTEFI